MINGSAQFLFYSDRISDEANRRISLCEKNAKFGAIVNAKLKNYSPDRPALGPMYR